MSPNPFLPVRSMLKLLLACLAPVLISSAAVASERESLFGTTGKVEGALVGVFYDLKRTSEGEATAAPNDLNRLWDREVAGFVNNGWDESLLSGYYRAGETLHAQHLYIPTTSALNATRAFGIEGEVEPNYWLAHYRGRVIAPATGVYRFVGHADNVVAVAINRQTVMVTPHANNPLGGVDWRAQDLDEWQVTGRDVIRVGDWVDLNEDEVVDIDILVGKRQPGGFHSRIWWQKLNEEYEEDALGNPILPIFRIADVELPEGTKDSKDFTYGPPWKGVE